MARLTANFSAEEMACKCGRCGSTGTEMDPGFMVKLQAIRDAFGKPMHVSSGYRCTTHNVAVGGAANSYHIKGRAVDVLIPKGADRFDLLKHVIQLGMIRGIGIYDHWIHLDDREGPYRAVW